MCKLNCFREFIKYSSLSVLGMIGLSCYILADTFFISKGLGAKGLTALNLAIPIYSFIHGSGLMIGIGGGTKYSIYRSMGAYKKANRVFTNAIYISAIFALLFVLSGVFLSGRIVRILGADDVVYQMTKTYLQVILIFAPAFLMNNVLLCFVRNDGAPQLSMTAMICGSMSNVILDYIFIFPCKMGIFGAVFATGLSPVISIIILASHFLKKDNRLCFVKCRVDGKMAVAIFLSGFPSLVAEVSSGIVIIVFNTIILGIQGNVGVAAYGVIANLSLVIIAVYTGIAQGIQPIISRYYGDGNSNNVRGILKYALVTMLLLSAIVYAVFYFAAGQIAAVFNSENNKILQQIAVEGLKIYFIACPFAGFNIIISIYFTSTEYPVPAHIISILRGFVVIIPMAFILASIAEIAGVWSSFPCAEMIVAIVAGMFFVIRKNQHIKNIDRK